MLNHVRTLLLNKQPSAFDGLPVTYVPPSFQSLVLSADMQGLHAILFPQGLDASASSYIADTIMTIAHAPELNAYALLPDSRITYAETRPATVANLATPRVIVEQNSNGGSDVIVRNLDTRTVEVTPSRGAVFTRRIVDITAPAKTALIPLLGGYLDAYYALPSQALTGTFKTSYTTFVAPVYNIGQRLVRLDKFMARPGRMAMVFDAFGTYTDALSTLKTTWASTKEAPLRFGALILAYAYQLEKQRLLGG